MIKGGLILLVFGCSFSCVWASPPWASVEKILGRSGMEEGGLFRIDFPRTDLNVTAQGVPLEPEFALTSRFFFKPLAKGTLLLGDLVLLDPEVPEVTAQLTQNGFHVLLVHDFLLNESPGVKLLHFSGKGSRANLAQALKGVLSAKPLEGTVLEKPSGPSNPPTLPVPTALGATPSQVFSGDWGEIQADLGPGNAANKILQYEFPGGPSLAENDVVIPPFMGLETQFRFQKIHGAVAGKKSFWDFKKESAVTGKLVAATGQFLLTPDQVGPVREILEKNNAAVAYISELPTTPKASLIYFWAMGPSEEVAGGIKMVLDKVKKRSGS